MTLLTKSKFISALQCPRLLWHSNKKLLPEVSIADQHRFDQGAEFEKFARLLFPEGINLENLDFNKNLEQTEKLIKNNVIIFEASFKDDNLFIRSDVLEPVDDKFNLYEIKSTTEVKPQHISDLAFQKYVLEKLNNLN